MANTTGRKFGGREIGTPNKITSEIRERYSLLVGNNMDRLQDDLDSLEPKERVECILKIARFVLPTLKAIDMDFTQTNVKPLEVNFHYTDEELENRIFELIKKRDDNND